MSVPGGFATTAFAFNEFLELSGLNGKIHDLLDSLDEFGPGAAALQAELDRAEVVGHDEVPAGVVTMNSRVHCREESSGKDYHLTLVYPQDAGAEGTVSILAPVGSALLGLSVGQHIDWAAPGGKVLKRFGTDLTGKHFAIWGLAFKANTDDMRKATSRDVIQDLLDAGATVTAYDPVAMKEAQHCFPDEPRLSYAESQTAALEGADALIIVTEWREFRSPDFENIKSKLKQPVIFDGRNLYDPKLVRSMGIEYQAIGR